MSTRVVVVVDDSHRSTDDAFVEGCWGTISELQDQTYYDDRSDADDDIQKGRIKFSTKLYGRDDELDVLTGLYNDIDIAITSDQSNSCCERENVQIVFLGGYSGVGKTELVKQLCTDCTTISKGERIIYARGKYSKLQSAAVPFSAISDSLGELVANLTDEECKTVRAKLSASEGMNSAALVDTFPYLAPLLFPSRADSTNTDDSVTPATMNEVKEAFKEFLSCVCGVLRSPLIWFLDDFQWSDEASLELLKDVLISKELNNLLFIGAYRSNEVKEEHPFHELMKVVEEVNNTNVHRLDLFGLSSDDVAGFIVDALGKDSPADVTTLTEIVFKKTLGNIFFVKQALEELVRKNALYYDMMTFSWEYNVSTVQLDSYLSDDLIDMIQSKIIGLSIDVKKLVVIMSLIPNNADASTIKVLLGKEGVEPTKVEALISKAIKHGLILHISETGMYAFAHDKIREASFIIIPNGRARDELLVRISHALIDMHISTCIKKNSDWMLFVAIDHMNSVSPELEPRMDVARWNLRVARMKISKGATKSANLNVNAALAALEDSGEKWNEYKFTLSLMNELIALEFMVGNFDTAFVYIEDVLGNATTLKDKSVAYLHRIKTFAEGENRDYIHGVVEGLNILELYGVSLSNPPSRMELMKEGAQLKALLRNRPLTVLSELPKAKVSDTETIFIFDLLCHVQYYAIFTGEKDLLALLTKRAVSCTLQKCILTKGMVSILTGYTKFLSADINSSKKASEYGMAAEKASEVFPEDVLLGAECRMVLHATVYPLLGPYRDSINPMLDSYIPLLKAGRVDYALGGGISYALMYLCAGLPLHSPLLEPKLLAYNEAAANLRRPTFQATYASVRQLVINLRKNTINPTELKGDAFNEEHTLSTLDGNSRSTTLRDTSTLRLFLALIFRDDACMMNMLDILSEFAKPDIMAARTYLRLYCIGLAGFDMGQKKNDKKLVELAKKCLDYFKTLSKLGSASASPIYELLKAVSSPSKTSYDEAISLCYEARLYHFEAMACESCGVFLKNNKEAEQYITRAYWLYADWGAASKANSMIITYPYLKGVKRGIDNTFRTGVSSSSSNLRAVVS